MPEKTPYHLSHQRPTPPRTAQLEHVMQGGNRAPNHGGHNSHHPTLAHPRQAGKVTVNWLKNSNSMSCTASNRPSSPAGRPPANSSCCYVGCCCSFCSRSKECGHPLCIFLYFFITILLPCRAGRYRGPIRTADCSVAAMARCAPSSKEENTLLGWPKKVTTKQLN